MICLELPLKAKKKGIYNIQQSMQHEARYTIRVIDILQSDKYDQYEIQIDTSFETYTCYLRFSELRRIFKNVSSEQAFFPSCSYIHSFFKDLLSPEFGQCFRRHRFQQLKKYFAIISSQMDLKIMDEFWKLISIAKEWQVSQLKAVGPKPRNLEAHLQNNKSKLLFVIA